jgi:catechol 2,3-dioxygenase-like lactoylglutathione lyase family enzyme
MPLQLDHLILKVNDAAESVAFFTTIVGLEEAGAQPPFSVVRVSPGCTLQLAPWGTKGGEHLAFAMSRSEFDGVFERIRAAGIPYGDSFHNVGNMLGPGDEAGAQGPGKAVYFFDPNKHLIEIRYYD